MKKQRYSLETIESLKKDRYSGLSIPELVVKYKIPKTSIWHHVHGIILPPDKKADILTRQGGSHKRRLEREQNADDFARQLINSKQRELVIAVTMLYWAEGHKRTFVFTNTDSQMLRLYLKFLTTVLGIEKKSLIILLRTSDPIKPKNAIEYWSRTLKLPSSVFRVNHDNIQNRTKTEFGICRIMVSKSGDYHKVIQSLMRQIQTNFLPL